MMTFAVYDLPWYRLQKKDRILVHLLMGEIQRTPTVIRSIRIYLINMVTFLQVMKFNFTGINVIRKLVGKS